AVPASPLLRLAGGGAPGARRAGLRSPGLGPPAGSPGRRLFRAARRRGSRRVLLEELAERVAAFAGEREVDDAAAAGGLGEGLNHFEGVEGGLGPVAVVAAFVDDADQVFRE